MSQITALTTLTPFSALEVLRQTSKLPEMMLVLDKVDGDCAILELWAGGLETAQRVVLKPDGTWYMKHVIVVGEMPE